jgi:hypothetical protein
MTDYPNLIFIFKFTESIYSKHFTSAKYSGGYEFLNQTVQKSPSDSIIVQSDWYLLLME